jgi:hypothetical protein
VSYLRGAREQVAIEIVDAIKAQIEEPDEYQLRKAREWIADALKAYELAILKAAGVVVKDDAWD